MYDGQQPVGVRQATAVGVRQVCRWSVYGCRWSVYGSVRIDGVRSTEVYGRSEYGGVQRAEQVVGSGRAHHRRLSWRRGLCTAVRAVMRLREPHVAVHSQPETDRWIH